MLNELENKIIKAIPELMELGVGCEIDFNGDVFIIDGKLVVIDEFDQIGITFPINTWIGSDEYDIIGKQIQLNHLLDYLNKIDAVLFGFSTWQLSHIIGCWNLKSNLLSDQSEELIKFVNELKND